MYNNVQIELHPSSSRFGPLPFGCTTSTSDAYARLIKQPTSKPTKFRYESEERAAGGTYIIEIMNYTGQAEVYVSCLTAEEPYRAHPHKVTGDNISRNNGAGRIDNIKISPNKNQVIFSKLGVQCVKKDNMDASLKDRKKLKKAGDPFNQKFAHVKEPIDLKAVRLCFEVFVLNPATRDCDIPLKPILSDVMSSKPDLKICHVSHCFSYVDEEKEVTILCDKVERNDIIIQFFQNEVFQKEDVIWTADATIICVHRGFGIIFRAPKYPYFINEPVRCHFQLYRPSDEKTSEPRAFEFHPTPTERLTRTGKRRKTIENLSSILEELELKSRPPSNAVPTYRDFQQNYYLVEPKLTSLQQPGHSITQLASEDDLTMDIGLDVDSGELRVAETLFIDSGSDTQLPVLRNVNLDTEYVKELS